MRGPPETLLWVVDDLPSTRFPIYTRGNTGEVYPNVITPLCGSIVNGPIKRGQERVFLELGAVVPADLTEFDRAVLTGCFAGYLYANLSVGRLMGARTPGMKPTDVDTQMFGTSDAPPYRRQPGDRNVVATARLARFMVRALRGPDFGWLHAERQGVEEWVASRPVPAGATEEELFTTVDEGAAQLTPTMRSLLLASAYGGLGASLVERLAARADPETRAQVSVGVGGVESADPATELSRLAGIARSTPEVAAAFDAGTGVGARIDGLGPNGDEFRAALHDFVARFGARGPDEWELASETWGTDPDIALAAVERIMRTEGIDPAVTHARLAEERADAIVSVTRAIPAPTRAIFRRAAQSVADGAAGREFAKGTVVITLYAMRLALFELVRRAQDAGAPANRRDCWLVTRGELPSLLRRPKDFDELISERRERGELLQSRVPPFVFESSIPDPQSWERRDVPGRVEPERPGARLAGIAVSPGMATGPVRVIRDPSNPGALEPGDVLVAPITDPAWTPLFLVASAVVCEVGANLSHAAIVARELGIPAVVSVEDATRRLVDGTVVEVDGTAGTVTVVGRDP